MTILRLSVYAPLIAFVACTSVEPSVGVQTKSDAGFHLVSSKYKRSEWGGWRDADKDCLDTRQEVLVAESIGPVTYKTGKRCKVATGTWRCLYTGTLVTNPRKLDVDHVVALKEANSLGGSGWDRDKKRGFANQLDYPEHLIAVTAGSNRSKSAKGPNKWMPKKNGCRYLLMRLEILSKYSLEFDADEYKTLMGKYCKL